MDTELILFHGTSTKFAREILRDGARAGMDLTSNPVAARQFARYASGGSAWTEDKRKQGVVLEVRVQPEETTVGEYGSDHHFVKGHVVTTVPIPTSRIRVMEDRTASLIKTADEDQCPYCAGDSTVITGHALGDHWPQFPSPTYLCEDGHVWSMSDPAAQRYHGPEEHGVIQPLAGSRSKTNWGWERLPNTLQGSDQMAVSEVKRYCFDWVLDGSLLDKSNPHQYDALMGLVDSIEKDGFKSPLVLYGNEDGSVELIDGNHRLAAAIYLGLSTVPVVWMRPRTAKVQRDDTTNVCIMAVPAAGDEVHQIGPEDKHATLLYFGDIGVHWSGGEMAKLLILEALEAVAARTSPFFAEVTGVEPLGHDEPPAQAWMLDSPDLQDLFVDLLEERAEVQDMYDMATKGGLTRYDEYLPHVTIGYGDPLRDETEAAEDGEITDDNLDEARQVGEILFDRLSLWWGDEHIDVPLGSGTTVTARQDLSLPRHSDGPILRNWKGYSDQAKKQILAAYVDLCEGRLRPDAKDRPPLVGYWTANISGPDRIIVDDLPGGDWVLLGAVFDHNYEVAEKQIAGWQGWKARQGSKTAAKGYHYAPRSARQDIEQHGLDWRRSPRANEPQDPRNKAPVATYFSPDMGTALEMELGSDYDLYEVELGQASTTPDPYQPEDAFYTLDAIPASQVRRVGSKTETTRHIPLRLIQPSDYRTWRDAEGPMGQPAHALRLRMAQDELARGEARPALVSAQADGTYKMKDGHHRWVANALAGYDTMLCTVENERTAARSRGIGFESAWSSNKPEFYIVGDAKPVMGGDWNGHVTLARGAMSYAEALNPAAFVGNLMSQAQQKIRAGEAFISKSEEISTLYLIVKGRGREGISAGGVNWVVGEVPVGGNQFRETRKRIPTNGYGSDAVPSPRAMNAMMYASGEPARKWFGENVAGVVTDESMFDAVPQKVTVYRGISLKPGQDPASSVNDDGGVGRSWTVDPNTARAIAERGRAGFTSGAQVMGDTHSVSVDPDRAPVATVLRAQVELVPPENAGPAPYRPWTIDYASEAEIDIPKGTEIVLNGYQQAEMVDRGPDRNNPEYFKLITWRWPSNWKSLNAKRTAAVDIAPVVAAFATKNPDLMYPMGAYDQCHPVSEAFARDCKASGIQAEVVSGVKMGESEHFPGVQLLMQGHFGVMVGDKVYDWTIRQFEHESEVPKVWTRREWDAEWNAGKRFKVGGSLSKEASQVKVYRGVSVAIEDYDNLPGSILSQVTSGTGTNFQHGTSMSGAGAGVHWTTDKRVAQNFSAPMNLHSAPKTLHSDGWGVSVPVVITAEVSSSDVVTSAEELRDAMVEGHGWEGLPNPDRLPESEVLVRRGAPVRVTSIEAATPLAGWGRVRSAVENMEAGNVNGWRCDWKSIGGGMSVTAAKEVTHAGIAIQAEDTGRVLMMQRSWDETDDPDVRGTWEYPGGSIDEGESPEEAAWREFHEETGLPRPECTFAGSWVSNGVYQGHLFRVAKEAEAFEQINPDAEDAHAENPDAPMHPDVTAWMSVQHIKDLGKALRPAVRSGTDWDLFKIPRIKTTSHIRRTSVRGKFWRVHPNDRPFGDFDATSKPFFNNAPDSEPSKGYSCFENPWHLYFYVKCVWSGLHDGQTVLHFPGERVGTGYDGEELAIPSGLPRKTTWGDFVESLTSHPFPATPVNPGGTWGTAAWYRSWQDLAKRLEWLDMDEPIDNHIIERFGVASKTAARTGTYYRIHHRSAPWVLQPTSQEFRQNGYDEVRRRVGDAQEGYSCFENPWHVLDYVLRRRWEYDASVVHEFRGTEVGRGTDGEPLVIPSGQPTKTWSKWGEFMAYVLERPMGSAPTWKGSGSVKWGDVDTYIDEVIKTYDAPAWGRIRDVQEVFIGITKSYGEKMPAVWFIKERGSYGPLIKGGFKTEADAVAYADEHHMGIVGISRTATKTSALSLVPRGNPMGSEHVWEARDGGALAGYLSFSDRNYPKVRIKALEVNPAHQRKGVGTWLLKQLLDTYDVDDIDPGSFTGAGAALWTRVTGRPASGSTTMTLPNSRDWSHA